MKHNPCSAGGTLCLLLAIAAAALMALPFAQAAHLTQAEPFAVLQEEAVVQVEDFGAVGDGVHDDAEAIEKALNSGAATVEFGVGKTYLIKKAIQMTASNVEIAGNGATLAWDSETPFEDWRELRIVGWEPDTPVTNIYLHHLNFLTPNMSTERRVSSVQLILFNCSNARVEDCDFLITEGRGNEVNTDGGRGATNIWIYGECHDVTVQNCTLRNLSHASGSPVEGEGYFGAGGNIWVSGYSTDTIPGTSITDIYIQDNQIEKSCHDESIAVWSAAAERIFIDHNVFDLHEKEDHIADYSDMAFTFGNLEGDVPGAIDTVKDVHFTNNTVRAETRNYLFLCGGDEGSEPVDISNNDLTWTKIGSMNSTVGLVHPGRNLCDTVLRDNVIRLENSGDSGNFYRVFSPRRTTMVNNTVVVNRQFSHLCDLDGDAAAATDTSTFENNRFIINTGEVGNYFYQGYGFHGNTVEFNDVSPNALFTYYDLAFAPKVTADLSGNRFVFNGVCGNAAYGRTVLTVGNCTLNGCQVDLSGSEFVTTVPQSGDTDYALVSVSGTKDGETLEVRATDTRSNLFDQLWIGEGSAAAHVVTDSGEYSGWARLPLMESVTAVLSREALAYTVTAPELSAVTLIAACYDESGRMLDCVRLELAIPDSGIRWARGDFALASLFPPETAERASAYQLFLLENDTFRPMCRQWAGNLPA